MLNTPIAAPAPAKNPADRISNSWLSQITIAAGIAVSRHVTTKTRNEGSRSAMTPPSSLMMSPPDATIRRVWATPERTAVAAPHPASQPPNARQPSLDIFASSQDRVERAAQGFVPEHKAVAQCLVRQHALATEQEFFSEVAADHAQQRGGNPDNRRPVQVASESLGELGVGHGDRRCRIDRARKVRLGNHMRDQAHQIVAFDPGHPLLARAERSAEAELERRQHPRDEATVGADHESDPQVSDAHAMIAGGAGRILPGLAQLMAEAGV